MVLPEILFIGGFQKISVDRFCRKILSQIMNLFVHFFQFGFSEFGIAAGFCHFGLNRICGMVENKEGFWYPSVDEKSCIECKVCLKKCPVENTEFHRNEPHRVWAWRNKNDVDIMRSASGGAADSAAKTILQMGGVVYGAAYDEQLAVSHIEVTDEAERENLQSSKYVQSDPKDSYTKVKQRLSEGKTVLFTGTPCQIAGLYAFFGGNPENLYTVDLICHGVPSPKFFKKYLEYQNKQTAGRVIYFNFRSKDKRGWGTQYSDIAGILQAFDAFVFPSLFEGLGLAIIEAQAAGLPCVASTAVPQETNVTPYISYLDLDSDTAVWVDKIAETKVQMLNTDRLSISEKARECIREHGYEISCEAEKLENIYNS